MDATLDIEQRPGGGRVEGHVGDQPGVDFEEGEQHVQRFISFHDQVVARANDELARLVVAVEKLHGAAGRGVVRVGDLGGPNAVGVLELLDAQL